MKLRRDAGHHQIERLLKPDTLGLGEELAQISEVGLWPPFSCVVLPPSEHRRARE